MPTTRKKTPVKRTPPSAPRVKLSDLLKKLNTVYEAIFGRWDEEQLRDVPGMREDIKGIKDQMRLLRYGLVALGVLVSFGTAKAVGIPTQHIGEGAQLVWQYVQYALTHPSPP